ncbi:MAG: TonB-dependent receptor, partial [Parabacteroides sp.]|nr:TonB-dependent receptor [Parabacteroides sp.]
NTDLNYKILNNQVVVYRDDSKVLNNDDQEIISEQNTQQQKREITGNITDQNGEPIIGANIVEKSTTNGTITDVDGNFSLQVEENAVLHISYIGYLSQDINVTGGKKINIVLEEDAKALEELVVVGYGTQQKINLTGAVAQVRGEVLEDRSVINIGQALQGTVANLNITSSGGGAPGTNPNYNIRGYTGFSSDGSTSSQAPLVVIDGIQGGDINTINMNDVESISVLKDAASAAIYGSSAPYGVIIINTKRGKSGQKPTITYNNNLMFSQPINLPKYMKSIDFANIYNEASVNADAGLRFNEETLQRIQDYLDGKITTETIANPTPGADSWFEWGNANANNDWFKILYKDVSFSQQHNASISGGTEHSNYYIGLGYIGQKGVYNFTDDAYDRYNVRANTFSKITDWLDFNFRGTFIRGTRDYPEGEWMKMLAARNWPTEPLYVPNGSFASENRMAGFVNGGRTKNTTDNTILTGEFVIHPLAGWDITANYAFDGTYINNSRHYKTAYVTRPSGTEQAVAGTPNGFRRSNSKNQHHTINLFTSYEKKWGDHSFKGLIGFTQELYENLYFTGHNSYLYSDELPSLALTYGTSPSTSDTASQLAIRGGFGRINYNYKGKYLVEFNGRYDGTSRFLKDVRIKFYPGISAAWILSNESFWNPIQNIVGYLKIRGSYGQLGDQGFTSNYYPFYPSMNTVSPVGSNWLFSSGKEAYINQPSLINNSLTWITTSTLDFGVDLTFLSDRLNMSFDWYQRKADDFVGPAEDFPALLGASAPQVNNSAMVTQGIELTLGWKDKVNDFSYGVSAVLSDYQSEILKYPNETGLNTTWYKGGKLGDIWGYETVGFFQTEEEIVSAPSQEIFYSRWTPGDIRYADLNRDGIIDWGNNTLENPGDRKVIGNSTPRYSFGVNLDAEYKGIDLTIFLQGIGKRDLVFSNANVWDGAYFWGITGDSYTGMLTTEHYDRWTEDNPNGYFPKYYMSAETRKNTQTQTKYMQSGTYLRIKNIQLGYSLPLSLIQKINCQKLRVFMNIENLATFTSLIKTMDPEFGTTDGRIYPLQRVWACGLNITF